MVVVNNENTSKLYFTTYFNHQFSSCLLQEISHSNEVGEDKRIHNSPSSFAIDLLFQTQLSRVENFAVDCVFQVRLNVCVIYATELTGI